VGPLGRHAYTLAFGSAPLTKVILFNNSGPGSPSGGGGVVDAMIKKAAGLNQEEFSLPTSPTGQGQREFQVPRDFQIKTAYVSYKYNTIPIPFML